MKTCGRSGLLKATSEMVAHARSGKIEHARKLFDEIPERDTIAWNSILAAHSRVGKFHETLSLFRQMRSSNDATPDDYTFTAMLKACARANSEGNGAMFHALVIVSGHTASVPICNSLVDMYGKCFNPPSARKIFDETTGKNEVTWCSMLFAYAKSGHHSEAKQFLNTMPDKVAAAWNIMVAGLSRCREIESCLDILKTMQENSCRPDKWTCSCLMVAMAESSNFYGGCMVHALIIKIGLGAETRSNNSIISFYSKLGSTSDAIKVFEFTRNHAVSSSNAIIDAYMKAGEIDEADNEFQNAREKNAVTWTCMISGYARNGYGEEALKFFAAMKRNSLAPDDFTFGSVLLSCSCLALLGHGRTAHGCIVRSGFSSYVYTGNALINMYAKCGDLEASVRAFDSMGHKDIISFNSMLFAFGLHGDASRMTQLYGSMLASGTKPDNMTFVAVLLTCSHSGLVEKASALVESMKTVHGIACGMDHLVCMADMLCRGGHLNEATELAIMFQNSMAKATILQALLHACWIHGKATLGTCLVGQLLKVLEPERSNAGYVLCSNFLTACGKWEEAEMVRKTMMDGLQKLPGHSWIQLTNQVIVFLAGGDLIYQHAEQLHNVILFLHCQMQNPCL